MKKRLVAIGVFALGGVFASSRWEQWVMSALAPSATFDAAAVPAAPDYADPANWTAHPEQNDLADGVPTGLEAVDQAHAPVDVFYLHPTTHLGATWNGAVDDAALNAQTDELATRIQATVFNACCAVYGPRYRQAQGAAFLQPGADGNAAIDLAYDDVARAFRFFLERHSRGRPFVLAGHSQGAVLADRLLHQEIAGSESVKRLVAAYLIGAPIDVEASPVVPGCTSAGDTGCVVSFNARGPRFAGSAFDFRVVGKRLCVNPLSWRIDETPAEAALNEGAVFLHAGDGRPLPGFADAQCRDGVLVVSMFGDPPRDGMSRVLDFVIGPENYHPIEYQLFYMNLRSNAQERVGAYLRLHSAG